MRKVIFSSVLSCLVLVVVAVCFISCNKNKHIQKTVEQINSQCPISLGLLGNVTKVSLDGNTVVYDAEIEDRLMNISKIKQNKELLKKGILLSFLSDARTLNSILEPQVDLRYVYHSSVSPETMVIDIPYDELLKAKKELFGDSHQLAMERLNNQFDITRLQLPMQVDEITRLDEFKAEGTNVVYLYTIQADAVSLEQLKEKMPQIKEQSRNLFLMGDPAFKSLLSVIGKVGYGLVYRYHIDGIDGFTEFSYAPDEVAEILRSLPSGK